ncbi:MAG: ATP-binding cassette domain-containing protein, partial [Nanoarchaeota archaeon]
MDILRVEGLTKSFNKKEVLSDLSFSVKKGEIFGLVGRSGSGKSVLIKTLIGFYKPKRGKVFFE